MKKYIFAIIVAVGILGGINAGQANAQSQTFRIEVPFEFTANNKTLPSGTYVVGPTTDNRLMWRLQNAHQKPEIFLVAWSLSSPREVGSALLFRRYGDRHFLIGFRSYSYQVKLLTSASEKDFQRTWSGVAKNDLQIVEAVSKR